MLRVACQSQSQSRAVVPAAVLLTGCCRRARAQPVRKNPMTRFYLYLIIALLAFATALSTPALAIEIDMSTVLMGANGQAQQDCDHVVDDIKSPDYGKCDKYVTLTLGRLAAGAVDQPDQGLKPADIVIRGSLARKIRKALTVSNKWTVDLDPRDIDLIKEQIAKTRLNPSVLDQAFELLMPPAKN